jgi:Na+/glutamate symporter
LKSLQKSTPASNAITALIVTTGAAVTIVSSVVKGGMAITKAIKNKKLAKENSKGTEKDNSKGTEKDNSKGTEKDNSKGTEEENNSKDTEEKNYGEVILEREAKTLSSVVANQGK